MSQTHCFFTSLFAKTVYCGRQNLLLSLQKATDGSIWMVCYRIFGYFRYSLGCLDFISIIDLGLKIPNQVTYAQQ